MRVLMIQPNYHCGGAEIAGKGVFLVASDPATSTELFDVNPKRGDFETLGADDVAVSVDRMRSEGWRLGDRIPARFQTGPRAITAPHGTRPVPHALFIATRR